MPTHTADNITQKNGSATTVSGTVAVIFTTVMPSTNYSITLAPNSAGSNNGLIIATYRLKAITGFTIDTQYIYTSAGKTVFGTWSGDVDWLVMQNVNS